MATTLKGQTPPSSRARQEAKEAAAPDPVFTWSMTFDNADAWLKGHTVSEARGTFAAYGATHGADALAKYIAAVEIAIAKRAADPERNARIAERKAAAAARKAAA